MLNPLHENHSSTWTYHTFFSDPYIPRKYRLFNNKTLEYVFNGTAWACHGLETK